MLTWPELTRDKLCRSYFLFIYLPIQEASTAAETTKTPFPFDRDMEIRNMLNEEAL